jgi:hypothetical protein
MDNRFFIGRQNCDYGNVGRDSPRQPLHSSRPMQKQRHKKRHQRRHEGKWMIENVARRWRGQRRQPCPRLWWLKKAYAHAASYGYSLECEAKDVEGLEPRVG